MAETEEEKERSGKKLWQEIEKLPVADHLLLRAEFTRCFLKLPSLASQLLTKSTAAMA